MSLGKDKQEDLFSTTNILKDFLPEDDPMMIFSKEIYPAFVDEDFAGCYSSKGRNAKSPAFLACVTILQFKENMSDTEAAESCIRRIDWKIALHLPLEKKDSFNPSTLCYFRRRLKENKKMSIILDKIVKLAQCKGFIKKRTNQRIDATHIIAHVNRISTTDLLFRAVKCLVEEIEKKDAEYYEKELPEHIKERYSKRFSSFGMSKEKRGDKQAEIVEDGLYLRKLLEKLPCKSIEEMKQLEIMETIFKENVIIKQKEVDEKIFVEVEEIDRPKQTIFDPRDINIKMGKKGKTSWVGSKCHIVETAERGEINFITGMIHQKADKNDIKILNKIDEVNHNNKIKQDKLYCDSNYISGEKLKEFEERGEKLMGYLQGDGSKKPEGFKLANFDVDMSLKKAICPAGKESVKYSIFRNGEICIYFNKQTCICCKYYDLCVGDKNKKRWKNIILTPYHYYIQKRRKKQKTDAFKKEMRVRAQVEGTISESVRKHGLRYKKYRGEDGDQLQFYLTGAAINFKRLIKAIIKEKNNSQLSKAS